MSKERTDEQRVVVTGMGLVSCLGNDVEEFYDKLLEGQSGVSTIGCFPIDEFATQFAGWIKDFEVGEYMDRKQARRADPYMRYTMVAGKKALELADLEGEKLDQLDKTRCGVIVGSGLGGMHTFFDACKTFIERGPRKLSPFFVPHVITNMGGGILAIDLGFMGPNYAISTACATATHSIVSAANHIRLGQADLMVCGGVEAGVSVVGLGGFNALRALSVRNDEPQKASRPWDKGRDGFVLGEGAGVLVLESLAHAKKRGAPIYGEYLGGGFSCDAYHITELREDGQGVALCLEQTFRDAGVSKEAVNYINAHATATPAGDMKEIAAYRKVFDDTSGVTINATKSMTGHCLGAAGGVEAIALIQALRRGEVHPTINLDDPEDEILEFDVPKERAKRDINVGLSLSFGFGGHNAAIAMRRYTGE